VVAPDRHAADGVGPGVERLGELTDGPVVVEAREGGEALGRHAGGRGGRRDERVGVRRVADHDGTYVIGGDLADRGALRSEDAGVGREEIAALHARSARSRADEHRDAAAVERHPGVVAQLDAVEEREGAVLQLERRAFGGTHPLRDLEQPEPNRTLRAEHVAGGDAEEQGVADLPAGPGDGHGGGCAGHAQSLLRCQGSSPGKHARGTVWP
jgi:hypothetical protein